MWYKQVLNALYGVASKHSDETNNIIYYALSSISYPSVYRFVPTECASATTGIHNTHEVKEIQDKCLFAI